MIFMLPDRKAKEVRIKTAKKYKWMGDNRKKSLDIIKNNKWKEYKGYKTIIISSLRTSFSSSEKSGYREKVIVP